MKEGPAALETQLCTVEREWAVDGVPVLTAKLSVPRPTDVKSAVGRRIDRFYQLQSRAYLRYCQRFLFPRAELEYRRALAGSGPLPEDTAALTYHVTCSEGGLWSLYTDAREVCGGRTELLRRGDTWDLGSGYPLSMDAFFPKRFPIRKQLLQTAESEIRRLEASGEARYREEWRSLLRQTFSREHFYVTPSALCFFWQRCQIAPPVEGIPVFSLPFGEDAPRPPQREPPLNWAEALRPEA